MTAALPMRVPIQAGEPAGSLLHRLGTRWSMSRSQFERFVGMCPSEVARGERLADLAGLARAHLPDLKAATPFREAKSRAVRIGAAWTDVADLTGRALRICPGCIAADREAARLASQPEQFAAWARSAWFVRSIATCTVHDRPLVEKCAKCDALLGADSPAIDTCRCGVVQAEVLARGVPNRVDAVLLAMISGEDAPAGFTGAGLHHVSSHLVRLGSLSLGRSEYPPALTSSRRLELRDIGLEIVLAGDGRLFGLLDDVVRGAPPGRSGQPGLVSSYGWAWRSWLGAPTGNALDRVLREKVRRHAELSGIRSPTTADGVTLGIARNILGSGHNRARRVVAGAGLLSGAELRGTPMSIERGRVEALATELSDLLDGTMAARRLGIGRTQFRSLVAAGMVRPHELAERLDDRSRFSLSTLDALTASFASGLPVLARPPLGCVSLPIACRNASLPLAVALRAIVDGRLVPVAWTGGHRLDAVWVTVRDLRLLVPPKGNTAAYAARELELHYEAALWLAREGVLGAEPGDVDPVHVKRFAACFCSSAQLGRMLGISGKAAAAACRDAGLVPAFGPPGCRQSVWSLEAIRKTFGLKLGHAL